MDDSWNSRFATNITLIGAEFSITTLSDIEKLLFAFAADEMACTKN
jgi:hypothetical protein